MTNFIAHLGHSILSSNQGIQYADNFATIDLLNQTDSIYQIDEVPEISHKIDKINISPEQLSSVRLESLSEFMRKEILQYQLGKWNNHPASSISIKFPITELNCETGPNNSNCVRCIKLLEENLNRTLDKLTFQIEGQSSKKVYKLKDHWPVHGTDLAFKLDEGLKLRRLLSLGSAQDVLIVTNKLLPDTPMSSELNLSNECSSSTTSINSDIISLTDSDLFYQSELNDQTPKLNTNKPLPALPVNENKSLPALPEYGNKMYVKDTVFVGSTIFEVEEGTESTVNLLRNSTASLSTTSISSEDISEIGCTVTGRNLYAYPQINNGLGDAIINMMTDVERENLNLINQQINTVSQPITSNSNTEERLGEIIKSLNKSSDSLSSLLDQNKIENLEDKSKTIFDTDWSLRSSDLKKVFHYRSNSPISSPRSSTENLLQNKLSNLSYPSGSVSNDDID
jgi:hypothetical protein